MNPFLNPRAADIVVNHEARKSIDFGRLVEFAQSTSLALDQPRLGRALAVFASALSIAAG